MNSRLRCAGLLAGLAVATGAVAGCGSSSSTSTTDTGGSGGTTTQSTAAAPSTAALGSPNKATGSPITFGLLNLESGPVTFPEVRQAAEAAVKYVNDYKGGIDGHPIKIESCATDGQPSTSQRCANQILDKRPTAILGGADTGASGAFPVWKRARLAYIGGVPFTPAESNADNASIFLSLVIADNGAAVSYAKNTLGVRKAAILATDDTQGAYTGHIIENELKTAGIDVKYVPVSPSAADLSSPAAAAVGFSPDLVYVEVPNACPAALKALKSVGYSGKLMGIDPCTSPTAIKAAGDAAEGLYFAAPFEALDSGTPDAKLINAALAKYAPKDLALDSPALAAFGSIINIQAALSKVGADRLTTASILSAFRTGSDHPNFLAHPYTCDGRQVPDQSASCNGFQQMRQVKGGKVVSVSADWINGAQYYKPQTK